MMAVEYTKYVISISGIGRDKIYEKIHNIVKKYNPNHSEQYEDGTYMLEIRGSIEPELYLNELKHIVRESRTIWM